MFQLCRRLIMVWTDLHLPSTIASVSMVTRASTTARAVRTAVASAVPTRKTNVSAVTEWNDVVASHGCLDQIILRETRTSDTQDMTV